MDYTFTNFVVGLSNQFAHAAALAVANMPAEAYNPLILYGNTGLGKTHLLHAIAHRICQQHLTWRVVYMPAESFRRELLQALHHAHMDAFQEYYRQADVLLIDEQAGGRKPFAEDCGWPAPFPFLMKANKPGLSTSMTLWRSFKRPASAFRRWCSRISRQSGLADLLGSRLKTAQ